jgi:hypothetical protein
MFQPLAVRGWWKLGTKAWPDYLQAAAVWVGQRGLNGDLFQQALVHCHLGMTFI